jgi:hypothetical protein
VLLLVVRCVCVRVRACEALPLIGEAADYSDLGAGFGLFFLILVGSFNVRFIDQLFFIHPANLF